MSIAFGLLLGLAFGIIQYLIWGSFLKKPSFYSSILKVVLMGLISIFTIFIFLLIVTLLNIDMLIWTALGVLICTFVSSCYTFLKDRRRGR